MTTPFLFVLAYRIYCVIACLLYFCTDRVVYYATWHHGVTGEIDHLYRSVALCIQIVRTFAGRLLMGRKPARMHSSLRCHRVPFVEYVVGIILDFQLGKTIVVITEDVSHFFVAKTVVCVLSVKLLSVRKHCTAKEPPLLTARVPASLACVSFSDRD